MWCPMFPARGGNDWSSHSTHVNGTETRTGLTLKGARIAIDHHHREQAVSASLRDWSDGKPILGYRYGVIEAHRLECGGARFIHFSSVPINAIISSVGSDPEGMFHA